MAEHNRRELEEGIERDLDGCLTYAGYLQLETLLSAQRPVSQPAYHDEMLFIIQHQVAELWMKLAIHEIEAALRLLREDRIGPVLKGLARVKQIQHQLYEQWGVLETMTPYEYLKFRDQLGPASGFQSLQYRLLEFLLGNKQGDMLEVFAHDPGGQQRLRAALEAPSLYDESLRWLARLGHAVPEVLLERDWSCPHAHVDALLPVFETIYREPETHWPEYHLCETLVDIEQRFQQWRFRHMKTVERIIGHRTGTGGSSGVDFLQKALALRFFPELLDVRTRLG